MNKTYCFSFILFLNEVQMPLFLIDAILDVYDSILENLTQGATVDMVYLDFVNAFDEVDHGILFHKLRDDLCFFHFVSDRSRLSEFKVVVGVASYISGMPQGTLLGTLLFFILMTYLQM